MNKIKVSLSPLLYDCYATENSIVVVIDAIRASTSICMAFAGGAKKIITVTTEKEAYEYKKLGFYTAGERDGFKIEGFDFGNSPFEFTPDKIADKNIVFTTTNGTVAINTATKNKDINTEIIIGAFINISAIIEYIAEKNKDVVILCAGWKNAVNIEDTVFAGRLTDILLKTGKFKNTESSVIAWEVYNNSKNNYFEYLLKNSPSKAKAKELHEQFHFCLQEDMVKIVPVYAENGIFSVE